MRREHRRLPQAGRRHRGAHRALVRIRLHPFGSDASSRCTGAPQQDGTGELGDTNFVVRRLRRRGVRRHGRVDDRDLCARPSNDPNTRRLLDDPYTLTPDRGGRTGTRPPARPAVAARPRDRAGTGGHLDHRVRHGRLQHADRPAQQRLTGLRLRQAVPLRGAHERRLVGRRAAWPRRWPPACERGGGRVGQPVLPTSCRAGWSSASCPSPAPDPANAARETRPLHASRPTRPPPTGARYVATMSQQGDPGYKATSVLLGRERTGAGARPRQALRSARRTDPGGGDGRRAAGPIPGCRVSIGDRAAELISSVRRTRCQPRSGSTSVGSDCSNIQQ